MTISKSCPWHSRYIFDCPFCELANRPQTSEEPMRDPMPTQEQNPDGLHQRYRVEKLNGPQDPRAVYFVLRLDRDGDDPIWTELCRKAVLGIAQDLYERDHMVELAADLQAFVIDCNKPSA